MTSTADKAGEVDAAHHTAPRTPVVDSDHPSTMAPHSESNACNACARAKRKCGRQLPSCARCADRGTFCVYPPSSRAKAASSSRPLLSSALKSSVPREEDGLRVEVAANNSHRAADLMLTEDFMLDLDFPLMDSGFLTAPPPLIEMPSAPSIRADWFLAPETWTISHRTDPSGAMLVGRAEIKKYVAVLQSWIVRWVTTGSNPFIHSHLYSTNSPACVQVAYATLASYIHRTPANTDTILEIVEDRSNDILRQNGATLHGVGADQWVDGEAQDIKLDLFAELARLHALTVYQIIGLFDGDIRSRHVAEGHMAVHNSWAGKLFHSAAKALSNINTAATQLVGCLPTPSTLSQQQWYLWILSESIRRTWLVAVSLSPIYCALQQRWAPCPGGTMSTNRNGIWNAANATEWEKQCSGRNVAFLQRFDCGRLLDEAKPADIDEFGMAILKMTFSEELLEKWRDGSAGF